VGFKRAVFGGLSKRREDLVEIVEHTADLA
jgi:hypothetical protein